jgi:citrate synthase
MPVIAAISFRTSAGLPIVYPDRKLSYVENFLHMMFADPMDPNFKVPHIFVEYFEKLFILHADNEQGPSTTAVRIAGSSLANPFASISAGIASLWGPLHGGANEEQLKTFAEIGTEEKIPAFLDKVKKKEQKLTGFGHRIYKTYDPRALIIKNLCKKLYKELGTAPPPLFELAEKIEAAAVADDYFKSRHLYPNIDFYSGFIFEALQIPHNMFCVVFAITRCLGWVTHWREMMSEPVIRIGRPRQIYVGRKLRPFVPIDQRIVAPGFELKLTMTREKSVPI